MEEETASSDAKKLGTTASGGLWNTPSGVDFSGEIRRIRWTQSYGESSEVSGIRLTR